MIAGDDENQSLLDSLGIAPEENAPPEEGANLFPNLSEDIPADPDLAADQLAPDPFADPVAEAAVQGELNDLLDSLPDESLSEDGLPDAGAIDEAGLSELALGEHGLEESGLDEPGPNENADPAIAVDEMLSEALAPEELLQEEFVPAHDAANLPSFELNLSVRDPSTREGLKAAAAALSLQFPEGENPLFSQLSEYQVIAFRQAALKLGAGVKVAIHFPFPSLSEEEQALGELAAVPEASTLISEGAPAVTLPKFEKDVMVLTETPAGVVLQESLGIVTAHRSVARRFFREEEAQEKLKKELERVPGRANALPSSRLEALFRDLILDLQKLVLQRKGNALLGLRLESFPETSSLDPDLEQMRLVAFGTAAVVEKA